MKNLLAINLGVKTGMALYNEEGCLLWYRSQNYSNIKRLKRATHGLLNEIDDLSYLYIEGDEKLVKLWEKECISREIQLVHIKTETWRKDLFQAEEYLNADLAKQSAIKLANKLTKEWDCKKSKTLVHDAAEAILLGLWSTKNCGWIEKLPENIKP